MLRCNSESSSLDSIKLVSDNLSERVKLDYVNNNPGDDNALTVATVKIDNKNKPSLGKRVENWSASLELLEARQETADRGGNKSSRMTDMSMNSNNLMFRSMFFMNDEATRHFLAPPLPPLQPCEIQTDYFPKKLMVQVSGTSTPGSSSVTTSSTNTGNMSVSTANSNTTGTNTTGSNTANAVSQQTVEVKHTISLPKQRPHTCEECGKTFLMKHHLLTHMRVVHTGERPYICPECGKSFALKHCLSTHLLLHTAERPYKCNECNKSFTLKHHLVSHERVHTRDRPFECTECGQRFPQKRHLSTHIKFHSGERPFSCQVCGESFSREEHLVMHSRFHGGLSPYNCPDCGAGFLRKFELVNHERQHGRNPESCPNCGKEFLQKRTLLVHVRSCNGNGPTAQQSFSPPRFSEGGSSPRFSDNSPPRLNDGIQRFQNSNSPRYYENNGNQFRTEGQRFNNDNSPMTSMQVQKDKVCKECGETFSSVEGLALHLRLHFGDHSFLADICSLAASLKQTAANVAASLKKTHICTDCGRGFTQRHGLFQHRQRHANGSCKEKPFACEKCGKSFAQKNHLMLHERQHMDLPPRGSKNQKARASSAGETAERMDTGETTERTQGSNVMSSDSLNRHTESEKKGNAMMMQSNITEHQREIMNRHTEPADNSSQEKNMNLMMGDHRDMIKSSDMMMPNHPDHQRVDMLNRHTKPSNSPLQEDKGMSMMMQSSHTDHQRELMTRHPSDAESSQEKNIGMMMPERMMPSHSDSHLMNRHSETHRTMNNPVPVALVSMHNRGGQGNRPMISLQHLGGTVQGPTQVSETGMQY